MLGVFVSVSVLISVIAFSTGLWRPKYVREQDYSNPPPTGVVAESVHEVLTMQCSILEQMFPEKERIRDVA